MRALEHSAAVRLQALLRRRPRRLQFVRARAAAPLLQRVYRGRIGRRRFWIEQNAQRKERALVLSRYERLRESAMLEEVEEEVLLGEERGHDTHR